MFDCRSDDTALYVGRGTGFTDFLNHVFNTCPAIAKPTVIGDDAITRFVAQGKPPVQRLRAISVAAS